MQHVVKAPVVKVSIGSPGGNRIARILRAGATVPEGVHDDQLKALVDRGLIEKVVTAGDEVPNKSAKVGEWRSYVVAAGLATDEQASKATKEDLIKLVDGTPLAPPAGGDGEQSGSGSGSDADPATPPAE